MVNVQQLILSLSWLSDRFLYNDGLQSNIESSRKYSYDSDQDISSLGLSKSVAVVGAGSAGLAVLKTLSDVAESTQWKWEAVAFEKREDVGGVWLPDPEKPHPPHLPETPLYPMLRTNIPHPFMGYRGFPYPPMTNLFPHHEVVQQYHYEFASHHNLTSHIRFNHTTAIMNLIATGTAHFPRIPAWSGQQLWLDNTPDSPKREILHSIYWQGPHLYENKTILLVGAGATARDVIKNMATSSKKIYLSVKDDHRNLSRFPSHSYELRSAISYFTNKSIFFEDETSVDDVESIILATGYEIRVPFLENSNVIKSIPEADSNATYSEGLVTNLRYVFPLYRHIFSLAPQYPPTALAFIGLPAINALLDIAQSLFIVHAIANADILPSREEMLQELTIQEENIRLNGSDPYHLGHQAVFGSINYFNELVEYLKEHKAIPEDGRPFFGDREAKVSLSIDHVTDAWTKIEELGREEEWLTGVETEHDWLALMEHLVKYEIDG